MKKEFVLLICESGDYEALYVDGKLKECGHSIQMISVVKHMKHGYKSFDIFEITDDYMLQLFETLDRSSNEFKDALIKHDTKL